MRDLGLDELHLRLDRQPATWSIYTLVIAGLWHASGLVMAILLAGLRGVDADLWKAARVDGIPTWRVYLSIVLPLLGPMLVTAIVLLAIAVVAGSTTSSSP